MPNAEQDAIVRAQIEELYAWHAARGEDGVVGYHPSATRAGAGLFGMAFTHVDGAQWRLGDAGHAFPMQSIAKVFIYALALEDNGREAVLRRVGVEPSGDPFNSITFDEAGNRPFNPMINAGALVATSLVRGGDGREKVARLVGRLRAYSGNPHLRVDEDVLAQELASNDRNLAISYLMRSLGMLEGDLQENLTVYLSACSVRASAVDLANMGATLAHGGRNPITGDEALPRSQVRDVVTVMMMCGMYTAAGEWAYDVGIPAKSAVSGGVLVTMPSHFGGAVFSPGLDRHGNSVRGVAICRDLSTRFGLHMYADPAESTFGRPEGLRRRPPTAVDGSPG